MTHPARTWDFDALVTALEQEHTNGNVAIQRDGELALYCYTKQCVYSGAWTPVTEMARGLILDTAAKTIVATPWPKFFNVGERQEGWPDGRFETYEKLDGSLIILFHHDGRWRTATKGSFSSDQAKWAQDYLHKHPLRGAVPGWTYLAEYVGPDNRIVVPYAKAELVLLGGYTNSGIEICGSALHHTARNFGWRSARQYEYASVSDLIAQQGTLPPDEEGFVVRFANGLRLKIKGEHYRRIHAMISNCTPLALWAAMRDDVDLAPVRRDLPEEFWADFDAITTALNDNVSAVWNEAMGAVVATENLSDKELGLRLDEFESPVRTLLFPLRKAGGILDGRARDTVFRHIRPTGNRLAGYAPSFAMNRVAEEAA